MKELMSPEYKRLLVQKMSAKPWGGGGHVWPPIIIPILGDLHLKRPPVILDYGAGKGKFKQTMAEQMPTAVVYEYEPGVPAKAQLPKVDIDFVLCTDVIEHIEPEYLDVTLERLAQLSRRYCFMAIACNLSGSTLPDGRNTHLIVQQPEWWIERLAVPFADFKIKIFERTHKLLVVGAARKIK